MTTGRPVSTHDALGSATRRHLIELLFRCGAADAHALAGELGLQVSTIRFHLDVLTRAELVSSRPQSRASAGRPRIVYQAIRRTSAETEAGYAALSALLAANFGDTPRARSEKAEHAGRQWARELHAAPQARSDEHVPDAARQVTALFAELGFEPELGGEPAAPQIRMRACPFRAVARDHPDVVCSVHLGLLKEALKQRGTTAVGLRLEPFVAPELCIAHLALT